MAENLGINVFVKLNVDPVDAAKTIDSQKRAIEDKINGAINLPVDVDEKKASDAVRSAIRRINTDNKIEFPLEFDTSGMDKRFESVLKQINNFQKKIQEAGGVIKRMQLSPLGFIGTDKETGEIVNEDAYRAVIQYQTAIGEVVKKTVEMTQSGNVLSDYVDNMTVDFQKQRDTMNEMSESIAQYTAKLEALKRQAAGVLTGSASDNPLKALFDSIDFTSVNTQEELDAMIARFKQAQAEVQALNAAIGNKKLAGTAIEQMNDELAKMPATLEKIKADFAGVTIPDDIAVKLRTLEEGLKNIDTIYDPSEKIEKYSEMKAVLATIPAQLKNIQVEQEKLTRDMLAQQKATDQLAKLWARYQASGERYSAFKLDPKLNNEYKKLGATIEHLKEQLAEAQKTGVWNPEIARGIQSANAQLGAFNNTVVAAGKNTKSLADQFKNAFSKFGTWLSATSIFMKVVQGTKNAIQEVKTLDSAMVNLKKVTDETDESYTKFLQDTGKTARQIGSTMSDLVESTSTFAKLGYNFKDAQELAEVATIFGNVGDFSNIDTATSGLITALKAFNLSADEAMGVADRINEVANRFAVSADDLTTGLANSASALNLAGNNIDQTIAMITAMAEITQDASEAGNAIKILSMRLRGAKTDLEAAGEDTDGMCESTSKLRETILALTGSVDIMADKAGTRFKSTYQIMQEIAQVWNDLTDINQAALLETIAGKMRGNSISALLTNMAQANKALETSMKSAGSALEEHSRWLDSIEAKEQQLKAAWQDFSDSVIKTDAVKAWYDGLTGLLNLLTQLVDKAGLLPLVLGGASGFMSMKKGGLFGTATNSNGDIVGRIGNYMLGSGGFSVDKLLNGSVNTAVIDQYREALSNGASAAEAMKIAVTDATGSVINLNGATRKALATETGAAKAMQQLGISTAATTVKTIAQTVAMKALNAALNVGVAILVSFVASKAAEAFSKISESIDRARNPVKYLKQDFEGLKEAFAETESDISAVNDELAQTQKRINALQAKENLSFIEKEELGNLQATNEQLERRLENLQKIYEQQNKDKASNLREQYNAEFQEGTKASWWAKFTSGAIDEDPKEKQIKTWINFVKNGMSDDVNPEDTYPVQMLRSTIEELYTILDEYPFEDDFSEYINGLIEEMDEALNPAKYKTKRFDDILGLERYKNAAKEIQNLANNGALTTDAYLGYKELSAALEAAGFSAEEAVEQFKALAEAQEDAAETRNAFSLVYEKWAKTTNAQNVGAEVFKAQSYFASITDEQYAKLVEAGDEYAACVDNINGYMQLNIASYKNLIATQYEEQKAAIAVGKAESIEKYHENAKAIKTNLAALEALGQRYDLTADKREEAAKTLKDEIANYAEQNKGILAEVRDYERLASQLEYATSAYKKWIDAQNEPNAGDAYDDMLKAMAQIQEGQESGKIGTARYKAAVELLVPDGRDVDNYMKTLERYLTEDSEGLQHFIDDMYKRANPFLSKNADGTYAFMEGVTVQDIARGLGLTDELARYMLQALQDYGWDVNIFDDAYTDTDALQKYEDAVNRVMEAQQRLNELLGDSQATSEELAAAEEEAAKAKQQLADTINGVGDGEEQNQIDKLIGKLGELSDAYQKLVDMKVEGFSAEQVAAIEGLIASLNGMPEGGYNVSVGVTLDSDMQEKQKQIDALEKALNDIQGLAKEGKISWTLAAELTGDIVESIKAAQASIDAYNKTNINSKEANVNVTVNKKELDDYEGEQVDDKPANVKVIVDDDSYLDAILKVSTLKAAIEKIDGMVEVGVIPQEIGDTIIDNITSQLAELEAAIAEYNGTAIDPKTADVNVNAEITSQEQYDAVLEKIGSLTAAIDYLNGLATDGVISFEMAAELTGGMQEDLAELQAAIDEYNEKQIEDKDINVKTIIDEESYNKAVAKVADLSALLAEVKELAESGILPDTIAATVTDNVSAQLADIEAAIAEYNGTAIEPKSADVDVNAKITDQEAYDAALEKIKELEEAISYLEGLANDGVISLELEAELTGGLRDSLAELEGEVKEFSENPIEVKAIPVLEGNQLTWTFFAEIGEYNDEKSNKDELLNNLTAKVAEYAEIPFVDKSKLKPIVTAIVDKYTNAEGEIDATGCAVSVTALVNKYLNDPDGVDLDELDVPSVIADVTFAGWDHDKLMEVLLGAQKDADEHKIKAKVEWEEETPYEAWLEAKTATEEGRNINHGAPEVFGPPAPPDLGKSTEQEKTATTADLKEPKRPSTGFVDFLDDLFDTNGFFFNLFGYEKKFEKYNEELEKYNQLKGQSFKKVDPTTNAESNGLHFIPGNVNLSNRKTISASELSKAGWGDVDPNMYATLFSQTYSAGDTSKGYDWQMAQNVGIVATPILPDGKVLSPEQLEKYLEEIISKSSTIDELKQNDDLGLLVGLTNIQGDLDEAYKLIDEWAEKVHLKQAELYDDIAEKSEQAANSFATATATATARPAGATNIIHDQQPQRNILQELEEEVQKTKNLDAAIENLGLKWTEVREAFIEYYNTLQEGNGAGADALLQPDVNDTIVREKLKELFETYDGQEIELGLNADPSKAKTTADTTVRDINKKTATIKIYGKYVGTEGAPVAMMAKGTDFAREEDAIVGEEGIETWLHDGRYQIVGQNGAELVHLSRGDQILTNEETKRLFGNKKILSGNAYASGKQSVSGSGSNLGGTKKKTTSSSKKSAEEEEYDPTEWFSDLVDWIPKALENLKKKTDEYIAYADKAVGYILKNSNLDAAIRNISSEVDLNMAAYERYLAQANQIATSVGLSADIIYKIQQGQINIESYDETTRKTITEYQKWYDLAVKCRDTISDLKDQQYDLAKQKLDNITQYYENRISLLNTVFENEQNQIDKKIASGKEVVKDDYHDMIVNTEEQIDLLIREREALEDEFNSLVAIGTIKEGSDDWFEYTNRIEEFGNTITEAQISIENFKKSAKSIVLTNLGYALNMLKNVQDTIQGLVNLRQAQGKETVAADYRNLIASSTKQIRNLEAQNEVLRQQQLGLDILSEEYQQIQEQINSNAASILSAKTQQEEWNDAIIDLNIAKLQEQNEEYRSQLEMMNAIEELEKAKQRRALIYHEGRGFNYEALESDIRGAKETLDQILFDRQVEDLQDLKKNNNLYDDYGNELAPIADPLYGLNLNPYYSTVTGLENSSLLADALQGLDITKLIKNADNIGNNMSVTIESGAINLTGVDNVNELAEAITNQLPNALMQQIYMY